MPTPPKGKPAPAPAPKPAPKPAPAPAPAPKPAPKPAPTAAKPVPAAAAATDEDMPWDNAPNQGHALAEIPQGKPPAHMYDTEDLGTGFEDFTQDDVAVPFIALLQKGNPQVEEDNPKFIQGAKPGMIFNTVSNEIYDGKAGIRVIPVHRVRNFIEWIPKDDGGGLVNVFVPEAPEVQEVVGGGRTFGKLKIGDGNDLVETFSVFCLLVKEDDTTERVVISMASSQIATYKRWMTMAQSQQVADGEGRRITPPMFSTMYTLTTAFTQKKDYTWYKWAVKFTNDVAERSRLAPDSDLYNEARLFRALVVRGAAKADFSKSAQEADAEDADSADYNM